MRSTQSSSGLHFLKNRFSLSTANALMTRRAALISEYRVKAIVHFTGRHEFWFGLVTSPIRLN